MSGVAGVAPLSAEKLQQSQSQYRVREWSVVRDGLSSNQLPLS